MTTDLSYSRHFAFFPLKVQLFSESLGFKSFQLFKSGWYSQTNVSCELLLGVRQWSASMHLSPVSEEHLVLESVKFWLCVAGMDNTVQTVLFPDKYGILHNVRLGNPNLKLGLLPFSCCHNVFCLWNNLACKSKPEEEHLSLGGLLRFSLMLRLFSRSLIATNNA